MRHSRLKRIAVAVTALTALTLLPQVGLAQETERPTTEAEVREHPRTIDEIKELALAAIDKRLEALSRISGKVSDSDHVTADHAASLQRHYASASDGLQALAREIEAAETKEALRELVPGIAKDFRVFLVIVPKSHEVLVSDAMSDAVERMSTSAAKLLEAIERAEEAGFDMTEARRWLETANSEIAAVEAGAVPVADSVINLTAADWEEPAKSLLAEGKRKLTTARADIREAIDALKSTRKTIKETIDG